MTTDTQARDEQEFEAWWRRESTNDLLRCTRDYSKAAWIAALAAERARSAVLVEALEDIENQDHESHLDVVVHATQALKQYRGEHV